MRNFFSYYGGKWRSTPNYPIPLVGLPIVEPFAGGAGYSVRHGWENVSLIEMDARVCQVWRYLIDADPDRILNLPDLLAGQTTDGLRVGDSERLLIELCLQPGSSGAFAKRPSTWMLKNPQWASYWGKSLRERIAAQIPLIRKWNVIEGDYTNAPDIAATWFIDPPYSTPAGRHYKYHSLDYGALAEWCLSRRGLVIVCEQDGARWLPFTSIGYVKGQKHDRCNMEVVCVLRDGKIERCRS